MRCNYGVLGTVRRELVNEYWEEVYMKCENYNLGNDFPVNTVVEILLVILNLKSWDLSSSVT